METGPCDQYVQDACKGSRRRSIAETNTTLLKIDIGNGLETPGNSLTGDLFGRKFSGRVTHENKHHIGGGFKHFFYVTALFGEIMLFDQYFSIGLKPPPIEKFLVVWVV